MRKIRWGVSYFLLAASQVHGATSASSLTPPESPEKLPYDTFPHVGTVVEAPRNVEDLRTEIKDFSRRVESTMKTFATRRNITCLQRPCLIQAFPLLYNSPGSGFFGGFRANLTDISRTDPYFFAVNMTFVRSDTRQWFAFFQADFPEIESMPGDPRIKARSTLASTTQNRYFGIGLDSRTAEHRPDDDVRYRLNERSVQASILFPIEGQQGKAKTAVFLVMNVNEARPSRYDITVPSKLHEDLPLGAEFGGTSSRMGLGIFFDRRDQEFFTRSGWSFESSFEVGGGPLLGTFRHYRFSAIDRRYSTWDKYTLAVRTAYDALGGDVPFWELRTMGGIDPVADVASPYGLRAYTYGRFHERSKLVMSIDHRYHLSPFRIFGQLCETAWVPAGIDLGRLGVQFGWSLSTGANLLFNKSFLFRLLTGYAPTGWHYRLGFGEEF